MVFFKVENISPRNASGVFQIFVNFLIHLTKYSYISMKTTLRVFMYLLELYEPIKAVTLLKTVSLLHSVYKMKNYTLPIKYRNSLSFCFDKPEILTEYTRPYNSSNKKPILLLLATGSKCKLYCNRVTYRAYHTTKTTLYPLKPGHVRKVLDLASKHKPLPNLSLTSTPSSNMNNPEASVIPKDISVSSSTLSLLNRLLPKPNYASVRPQIDVGLKTTVTNPRDQMMGAEVITRSYAGEFSGAYYKSHVKPMSNKIEIPMSEKSHLKIYFVADDKIYGVLTSSKFNKKTNENYHFISKEKHDGTICPLTNADGTLNEEGQYFAILKTPVQLVESNLMGFDKSKQDYLDKYENHIKEILRIHGPKTTNVSLRISKDDSILFNENGTRDADF